MSPRMMIISLSVLLGVCDAGTAGAQTPAGSAAAPVVLEPERSTDLKVSVYPVLLWVPSFSTTTNVPPFPDTPGGPDLPGARGSTEASLDGAFLAGVSLEKNRWRIDADGIWAAMVTQRDRPLLKVDLDVVYGHISGGVRVYKDLYVTGGVRRLSLKYDISLEGRPQHFERKPGLWDPLVGLGWHGDLGSRWTLHALAEGGGFGVGADVDLSGGVRADLKVVQHFGVTFGYSVLYIKLSDTVGQKTLEVKNTLHGPVVGLGLYF
jgi:hypothetical protein